MVIENKIWNIKRLWSIGQIWNNNKNYNENKKNNMCRESILRSFSSSHIFEDNDIALKPIKDNRNATFTKIYGTSTDRWSFSGNWRGSTKSDL